MTITRDKDIDLESGEYVPVVHLLKFWPTFEKIEFAMSCSSFLQQLKSERQKMKKKTNR